VLNHRWNSYSVKLTKDLTVSSMGFVGGYDDAVIFDSSLRKFETFFRLVRLKNVGLHLGVTPLLVVITVLFTLIDFIKILIVRF
jgi:hypothetical protein